MRKVVFLILGVMSLNEEEFIGAKVVYFFKLK